MELFFHQAMPHDFGQQSSDKTLPQGETHSIIKPVCQRFLWSKSKSPVETMF